MQTLRNHVKSFEIPTSWYAFSEKHGTSYFDISCNGISQTVIIDDGNYKFINATDERLAVNSTVKIFYNPENAGEVYSEFGEVDEDVEIGVFLTAIGAFCCVAISFVAIFLGIAQRIGGIGEDYELNRGGSSGVFGSDNSRSGRRNSRAVRRSGGSSGYSDH